MRNSIWLLMVASPSLIASGGKRWRPGKRVAAGVVGSSMNNVGFTQKHHLLSAKPLFQGSLQAPLTASRWGINSWIMSWTFTSRLNLHILGTLFRKNNKKNIFYQLYTPSEHTCRTHPGSLEGAHVIEEHWCSSFVSFVSESTSVWQALLTVLPSAKGCA